VNQNPAARKTAAYFPDDRSHIVLAGQGRNQSAMKNS